MMVDVVMIVMMIMITITTTTIIIAIINVSWLECVVFFLYSCLLI